MNLFSNTFSFFPCKVRCVITLILYIHFSNQSCKAGVGNLRPPGRIRLARPFDPAREAIHKNKQKQPQKYNTKMKSFNTARVVKQMSTLMLKYAIYAFSVEKQLKSVLNI